MVQSVEPIVDGLLLCHSNQHAFATYILFTNVLKLKYHLVVVISYQY